jgi:hypothetical protein
MNVLFFCPMSEKTNAELVLAILNDPTTSTNRPNVDVFNESNPSIPLENKSYDAIIIIYTPALALSSSLFEIVNHIDQKRPIGRFIFLPGTSGKEIMPPIFHPIRLLQLRLYTYSISEPPPNSFETQLEAFKDDWMKFLEPNPGKQPDRRGKGVGFNVIRIGLVLIILTIIIILIWRITLLLPIFIRQLHPPTPTSIQPPTVTAFWLQESFQTIDTTTRWQVQHFYTGHQAMQTSFSEEGLRLSASPMVNMAVFQLDSLQNWPLDELQSLSFSFAVSAMEDSTAKNELVFGLYLKEDNTYRLDCVILPVKFEEVIQCQIQSPGHFYALSNAVPVSSDKKHTATLVFDPLTYTLRFFLDERYYGQQEIPTADIPFWRTRSFNLEVRDRLENMNSGTHSCKIYHLDLARQP